jgi:hypothetical protein
MYGHVNVKFTFISAFIHGVPKMLDRILEGIVRIKAKKVFMLTCVMKWLVFEFIMKGYIEQ